MDIRESIRLALLFLHQSQVRAGWWWDFFIAAGASDEWVTAYVGAALASVPHSYAQRTSRLVWRQLSWSHWWSGGWGYNVFMPADADSTAWALRLAETLGASQSFRARRAYRFLSAHQRQGGGIAAFATDRGLRLVTPYPDFSGWCHAHPCISAAVAGLASVPAREDVKQYLRDQQLTDGGWKAYWWCDREYTTALAVDAFTGTGRAGDAERINAAIQWAAGRLNREGAVVTELSPEGSPFATALAARILFQYTSKKHRAMRDRAVGWLLQHQRPDGSWKASAVMRQPHPSHQDPDDFEGWVVERGGSGGTIWVDEQRIFTTATVLATLGRLSDTAIAS